MLELSTGALSWWKYHWPDLKSAGLFRRNIFLNSHKTLTEYSLLIVCPVETQRMYIMPVLSKKGSSKVCGWICSVWRSCVWESQHASSGNSVFLCLGHSSRSSFHLMAFFPRLKHNFIAYRSSKIQIAFLKFTSCDNQVLVGCIAIPAVAVCFNLES